ncbi:MAG: molybdenum cofactor guanylyltransferase [Deltaproteobacteria bacterium]|nr:molybdenum cofactor guanylyltransferase [Deltaproteobacteria bacterium]
MPEEVRGSLSSPKKDAFIKGVSCVILIGGESKRAGADKASIKLAGKSLLKRVHGVMKGIFPDIMVSAHEAGRGVDVDARVITDDPNDGLKGRGPVLGVCGALTGAANPWVFVAACDAPMVKARLVRHLTGLRDGYDCVVPIAGGRTQTLCALYRKTCLPLLKRRVKAGRMSLAGFLEGTRTLRIRYVGEDELKKIDRRLESFMDIDTPEDLDRIRKIFTLKNRLSL